MDEDRRDGSGRREHDDLATVVARIEQRLHDVGVVVAEVKRVSEDGFSRLNGRLRKLEIWKETQEALAVERAAVLLTSQRQQAAATEENDRKIAANAKAIEGRAMKHWQIVLVSVSMLVGGACTIVAGLISAHAI